MQTVFKYIYMFYTFRQPHFAGSDIHFIRTQTPSRPHLPDSRRHGSLPIAVSDGHTPVRHISLHLPKNHPIVSIHARKAV
ncbi:hypothetical protein NELON_11410 [Neisseria elongata subsp. glycolytica ATCC 29315]|uniref:Uncharacterized protein n=1 Tax=Neisseria elongata subsp. glycolytica ATCC 29315 TaxID=546263 RepID=A0A0B5CQ03_NEIEG|nr:hypothetical protein NELON_11410 [Neisseria elongata subsp. glycolytica ATCC 29315]SQH49232.1 Uncharacterised protein [Neisseria elongata subsp. glycolytica]